MCHCHALHAQIYFTVYTAILKMRYSPYVNKGFVYIYILGYELTARTSQFAKHLYIFAKRNCLANGKMLSENFENILHKHYNEHEYERAKRAVFGFNLFVCSLYCFDEALIFVL